jgi:hypothetical protein
MTWPLLLQDATQDDVDDYVMTGMGTPHGPAYNIDTEPLFDEALLAVRSGTAIGPTRALTRRTSCFVMLGYILAPIPFPAPRKREVAFGEGSVCTSMSIGSSSPTTSKVIAMISLFQSGGASFKRSATVFVAHSRT